VLNCAQKIGGSMATQEDQVALATALLGIVSSVGTIAETAETLRIIIPQKGLEDYESFLGLMGQHKMFCEWLVTRLLDGFDAETIEAAKNASKMLAEPAKRLD